MGCRPGHDGTQILKAAYADNNLAVAYMVPAGQTFYLTSCITSLRTVAFGAFATYIRDAVPAIVVYLANQTILAGQACFTISQSFWPPIEIPATYDVACLSSAAGLGIRLTIHGWVE